MTNKSWREKLENGMAPKVIDIPEHWAKRIGEGRMLVPSPQLLDQTVRKIPKGKVATVNSIREYMAYSYNADICCPITTGIFLSIVAHAAEESSASGHKKPTPYWRVLKQQGKLNPKFPGGVNHQAHLLKQEGDLKIKAGPGKELTVTDFTSHLFKFL